jgi:hypothetical protein
MAADEEGLPCFHTETKYQKRAYGNDRYYRVTYNFLDQNTLVGTDWHWTQGQDRKKANQRDGGRKPIQPAQCFPASGDSLPRWSLFMVFAVVRIGDHWLLALLDAKWHVFFLGDRLARLGKPNVGRGRMVNKIPARRTNRALAKSLETISS